MEMDQHRSEGVALPTDGREGRTKCPRAKVGEGRATVIIRELFFGVLYAMGGYLLGACALPFSAYPLGVAFLCASERRVPYLFVGLCLSAMGLSAPVVRISSYVMALLIRVVVRLTLDKPRKKERETGESDSLTWGAMVFGERTSLRMTTACLAVFCVGAYRLIEGDFLYYDLYGTLIGMGVAPVATLLFSGLDRPRTAWRGMAQTVGLIALSCALIYAARSLRVAYVSVSAFGAMLASLYLTRREGVLKGAVAGLLCGLAYLPAQAPLFALAAVCGGILFPVSVTLSTIIIIVVGSAWAIYVRGLGALSGLIPAILSASVLFGVIDRLFLRKAEADELAAEEPLICEVLNESAVDGVRLFDTSCRIKSVCEGFSSMSEIFSAMSRETPRPCAEELQAICDRAFDSSCASCQERQRCLEENRREMENEMASLSSRLYRDGVVDRRDVGEELAARCTRMPDILDEINHNAGLHFSRVLQSDRTEIFAADYAAIAAILAEAMVAGEGEYAVDGSLGACLAEKMPEQSANILGVTAWGKDRLRVLVRSRELLTTEQSAKVADLIAEQTSRRVESEASDVRADGLHDTVFAERERFSLSVAKRILRAEGEEEYCGDSAGVFARDGMQYAFISDGMGSGREAALTSGICSLFLQKMLRGGSRCETVISMLNDFLRNKATGSLHECSATMDLMALDCLHGKVGFYKCGAAPTYIFRAGSLFKLRSKTLPIGILKQADVKRIRFEACSGDVIVMVSDGVTQGREECPWLYDLLYRHAENLPIEKLADLIVRHVKADGSEDDVSVLVLRVEEQRDE